MLALEPPITYAGMLRDRRPLYNDANGESGIGKQGTITQADSAIDSTETHKMTILNTPPQARL